jgi:antibiotic biosynthesis monooxygenase (ABM) superfamily enzyme
MRQTKAQRKAYVSTRAVEMARSGKYLDWQQIEFALCFDEGYLEARGWLDSRDRREWLNRLCREARDGLANASQS